MTRAWAQPSSYTAAACHGRLGHCGAEQRCRRPGILPRYRADGVVDGVTIRVVVEPGGDGIITAFPVGCEDPANLLQVVRPHTSDAADPGDVEPE